MKNKIFSQNPDVNALFGTEIDLSTLPPQQPEVSRIKFDLNQLKPKSARFESPVVEPAANTGASLLDFAGDFLQKPAPQVANETLDFYKPTINKISSFFTNPEPITQPIASVIQPETNVSQITPLQNELLPIQPEPVDLLDIPMLKPEVSRVAPDILKTQEIEPLEAGPIQADSIPKQNTFLNVSEFNPNVVSLVDTTAKKNGIDQDVFRRLIHRESGFNPNIRDGKAGEVGLGQVRDVAFREVLPKGNIRDAGNNLEAASLYLGKQYQKALDIGYKDSDAWRVAAMAYNGGPTQMSRAFSKAKVEAKEGLPTVDQIEKYVDQRAVKYSREVTKGLTQDNKGSLVWDSLADVGGGGSEIISVYGHILNKVGNPFGQYVEDLAKRGVNFFDNIWSSELNKNEMKEPVTVSTGDGPLDFKFNENLTLRGVFFKSVRSLPAMVAGFGSGGIISSLLQKFTAKAVGWLGGTVGPKAKAAIDAVGFGFGEGTIEGGFSSMQVAEAILTSPKEQLEKSPLYQSYISQGMAHEDARAALADTLSSKAGFESALVTSALGAPMGVFFGGLLRGANKSTITDTIVKGALGETGQEFLQGGSSAAIEANTLNQAGFDQDPLKKAIEGGFEEAVAAPGPGIALGLASRAIGNNQQPLIDSKVEPFPNQNEENLIQREPIQPTPIEPVRIPAEFGSEEFNPIPAPGQPKKPHDILVLNLSKQLAEESNPESKKKLVSLIERAQKGESVRMLAKEIPVFTKQAIEQAPFGKKDIPELVEQSDVNINPETPAPIETGEAPDPSVTLDPIKPKPVDTTTTPLPQKQPVKAVSGKPITVKTVTQDIPSQYKVVEASSLVPSHDAKTFSKNPNYPEGVQERNYDTDKESQLRVIQQSKKFDPSFVLSDDPTPSNGPPVVTADGTVLGGNSRAMTIQRVYEEKGRNISYRTRLTNLAQNYGLNKADIQKLDKPVLVRVLDQSPQTTEQARFIGSDLNKGFTADLSETEKSISSGKRVSPKTVLFVASELNKLGETASLRKAFEANPSGILSQLISDNVISQREIPALFDRNRKLLTEKGKNFIESALLGKVIDNSTTLDNLPPVIKNKIGAALPTLLRLNDNKTFKPILNKALSMAIEAKAKGLSPENFIGQSSLFEDAATTQAEQLFLSLSKETGKSLKTKFGKLANVASIDPNQSSFINQPSLEQSFDNFFGGKEVAESIAVLKDTVRKETETAKAKQNIKPKAEAKPKDESKEPDPSKLKAKFLSFETSKLNTPQDRAPVDIEPTTNETITKTDILHIVEKQFGATVRNRVTHAMAGAAGWFERQSEVIRIKLGIWGEPQTLTHELAHFIDQRISKSFGGNWLKKALPKEIREQAYTELKNLDYDPKQKRDFEGFAEFFRHYLTTGRAKELAPTYFNWFENTFLKNALIGPDGNMQLPQEKKSFLPFFGNNTETPKGFSPLSGPIGNLKKAMATWYGQGSINRMRSQIDFDGKQEKSFEDSLPRKAYKLVMKELYDSNFIFEEVTQQVQKRSGKDVPPDKDPFALATFYKGKTLSIAETMVRKTMVDPFGRRVGPSLVDAIKPANLKGNKDMQDWATYAMALRAEVNHKRGLESGFEDVDIDHVIKTFGDRKGWKESAVNVSKWSDQLLDWYVWSGDLSEETRALFRELNPIYLPFMRIFRESVTVTGIGGVEEEGSAVKPLRNSTRPFRNPMESFIESAAAVVSRATKTRIARAVIDLGGQQGLGDLVTKVPLASHSKNFDLGDIAGRSEKLQEILKEYSASKPGEPIDLDEVVTLWYRDSNYYGKDNVVGIWNNGKLELFEIHQELYTALKEVDPPLINNKIMQVFASVARLMRLGFTGLNFSFSFFTNPVRDSVWAAVTTKKKMQLPGFNLVKGALKEITAPKGSITDQALNSGLQMATMMGFDRKATTAMYDDMVRRQLGPLGKTLHLGNPFNLVPTVLDKVRGAFQFFELAPRIVELETFNQLQKEHPEWSEDSAFIEAFNNAQDVTTNFTKSGRTGKTINQISAFYNVALQSPNKLLRAFKSNPVRTLFRSFLYVTLPAILMWDEVKDEEWYKNIPTEWKYLNMWTQTEDGRVLRIPGAHELFILFGGLVVAGLDEARNKDSEAVDGAIKALKKLTVNPFTLDGITPSLVKPLLEVGFNSNWLGHPVEPEWMRDKRTGLPIEDRKFYFTPELSAEISKAFRVLGFQLSPIQTNHILKQLTGNLYSTGLGILDTEKPKVKHPLDPRTFLTFPNRPTRQLEKFYTDVRNLQQKKNAGKANGKEQLRLKQMTQFQGRLKNLQTLIRRQQQKKTPQSLIEINEIYGRMAKQLNRFYGD